MRKGANWLTRGGSSHLEVAPAKKVSVLPPTKLPQQKFLNDLTEVLESFITQILKLPESKNWSNYEKVLWSNFQDNYLNTGYRDSLTLKRRQEIVTSFVNLRDRIIPFLYAPALTLKIRSDIKETVRTLTTEISALHNHLWMNQKNTGFYKEEMRLTSNIKTYTLELNNLMSLVPLRNGNEDMYLDEVENEASINEKSMSLTFPELPGEAAEYPEIVKTYESLKSSWQHLALLDENTLSTETRYLLQRTVDDYVPQSFELYTKLSKFAVTEQQKHETNTALISQMSLIEEQVNGSKSQIFDDLKTAFKAHTSFLHDRNEMYKTSPTGDMTLEGNP